MYSRIVCGMIGGGGRSRMGDETRGGEKGRIKTKKSLILTNKKKLKGYAFSFWPLKFFFGGWGSGGKVSILSDVWRS